MFLDKVEISIKAGDGGNGHTSFHRDNMTTRGGPDGGDGGKGGNIIFVCSTRTDNLIDFRFTKVFRAASGDNGRPNNKTGATGEDLEIFVPLGTRILNDKGELLIDMVEKDQRYLALKGGGGGRGNARFATSRRQTPNFSQGGHKTFEHKVTLELNSIADVGLIGFPNVGKSTLLSAVTRANPKIANYHFTTLTPNIGIYKSNSYSLVLADIPGLIEGASQGTGLGIDFLKHINRTRMLIHVIDISQQDGRDALKDFRIINEELLAFSKKYDTNLADKPQVIALNKIDSAEPEVIEAFKKVHAAKYKIFEISAIAHMGIAELMQYVANEVAKLPKVPPGFATAILDVKIDKNAFEIVVENEGTFRVVGPLIDNLVRGIFLHDTESRAYFQRRLNDAGVIEALKENGMVEGDTVKIAGDEFEWIE